ncbi:CBM_collapsed_G0049030.mRNA.1.CDS.1 [Saccharomyces cerevisiae]|nr:CBM_collapsed_G0049030.mRNA.1.CDS.1 [Saccharomyces cerevisiae]
MPKVYSYQEVAEHNGPENFWIIIDDKVYDVSQFKDEHPGGDEIIMDLGGQDATESFVDIGHSDEALRLLKGLYIGDVDKTSERVSVEKVSTSGKPK